MCVDGADGPDDRCDWDCAHSGPYCYDGGSDGWGCSEWSNDEAGPCCVSSAPTARPRRPWSRCRSTWRSTTRAATATSTWTAATTAATRTSRAGRRRSSSARPRCGGTTARTAAWATTSTTSMVVRPLQLPDGRLLARLRERQRGQRCRPAVPIHHRVQRAVRHARAYGRLPARQTGLGQVHLPDRGPPHVLRMPRRVRDNAAPGVHGRLRGELGHQ